MTKPYTYNIEVAGHTQQSIPFERWKMERRSGSYGFVDIVATKPLETFNSLITALNLTSDMDSRSNGSASNDVIFIQLHGQMLRTFFHEELRKSVAGYLKTVEVVKPETYIKWWYMTKDGPDGIHMPLRGHDPVDDFYPWMPKSMQIFADEYARSEANVLLLIGPPGTGKTSFIRGLVRRMHFETWVTYDQAVQKSEEFYVQFASINGEEAPEVQTIKAVLDEIDEDLDGLPLAVKKPDGRCLVMEDADEMLGKRTEGNELMKRLLNVSDGLVSLPKRKIIFSSNLPGLQSIDEALLRPGRCFGAVKFRKLTRTEAERACGAVGVTLKSLADPLTLSEALNGRQDQLEVQTIGFTPR